MRFIVIVICIILVGSFVKEILNDDSFEPGTIDTSLLSECDLPTDEPVIVFTTTWCGGSKKMKAILKRKNIEFLELDAEKDPLGKSAFKCTGGNGYPHLIVDGRVVDISSGRKLGKALQPYYR